MSVGNKIEQGRCFPRWPPCLAFIWLNPTKLRLCPLKTEMLVRTISPRKSDIFLVAIGGSKLSKDTRFGLRPLHTGMISFREDYNANQGFRYCQ
jgi:hypothetical protein